MTFRSLGVLAAALLFLLGIETLTFAQSPPVRTLTPQPVPRTPVAPAAPAPLVKPATPQLTVPKAPEAPITKTLPKTVPTGELTMTGVGGTAVTLPKTVPTGELTMTGIGQ